MNYYITDSRSLIAPEETIFVALKTRSGDGHLFIPDLLKKGVRQFILSEIIPDMDNMEKNGAKFHIVNDAIEELRVRASEKLIRNNLTRIAVIGSRGKTIVKEWIYRLLKEDSVRSIRSYNSNIGVPLSILNQNLSGNKSYYISEVGISKEGEMIRQQEVLNPQVVVITNITDEHDEGFVSRKDKIREKLVIAKNADIIVFNENNRDIADSIKDLEKKAQKQFRKIVWRIENGNIIISDLDIANKNKIIEFFRNDLKIVKDIIEQFKGLENLACALAAIVATTGCNKDLIFNRLERLQPLDSKLLLHEGNNYNKIIIDNYASDDQSIVPTLDFTRRIAPDKNKILVILVDQNNSLEVGSIQSEIKKFKISESFLITNQKNLHDFENQNIEQFKDYTILIIGGLNNGFIEELLSYFQTRLYETVMEINLDSLINNYNFYKSRLNPSTEILCMLKAFGYGSGSIELARTLQNQGAGGLAVAVIDEGIELRKHSISCPILILNPRAYNYSPLFENNLEPVIYNLELIESIISAAKKAGQKEYPIHIKLETGMRRLGFREAELDGLINIISENKDYVKVISVMSHLATADCPELDDYTNSQIELFCHMVEKLRNGLGYNVKRHILNSAGILRFPEAQFDMVRLGIGLYGIATVSEAESFLEPVASVYTSIISIKEWKAGDTIGYGCKGQINKDSIIATIPMGYADGLDRRLGNGNGYVIVNGVKCPIIGSICMDICMIDITGVPDCHIGTKVDIIGPDIPVSSISDLLETIPYEILTSISHRVKRVYYRES